jgi:hypothetical protein
MCKKLQHVVQRREIWGFEEREPLIVASGVPYSFSSWSDPLRNRLSPSGEFIRSPFQGFDEIRWCLSLDEDAIRKFSIKFFLQPVQQFHALQTSQPKFPFQGCMKGKRLERPLRA